MKRRWVYIKDIEPFDEMHQELPDGDFEVDATKDGQTTEAHKKSIESIKKILANGQKVMPILVAENGDGSYTRLDGFKRFMAQKALGRKTIECFICNREEVATQRRIPFGNGEMWCGKGGQPKEVFGLFEGTENENEHEHDITFLVNNGDFRIEVREHVHIHWGNLGQYRLDLGKRDFLKLAEAISKIDI